MLSIITCEFPSRSLLSCTSATMEHSRELMKIMAAEMTYIFRFIWSERGEETVDTGSR